MSDVNYCRRETGDTTPPTFCGKPIKVRNSLDWCQDCAVERLPMWPKNDAKDIENTATLPAGVPQVAEQAAPIALDPDALEVTQ